jgi:hypothetical protein
MFTKKWKERSTEERASKVRIAKKTDEQRRKKGWFLLYNNNECSLQNKNINISSKT